MQLKRSVCVALFSGSLLLNGAPAHADWWITPFAGTAFSGQVADGPRFTFGVSAAWTGASWLGFEADVGRTNDFFTISDTTSALFDKSRVTTAMGSVLVTSPRAWLGDRIRPYALAGLGSFSTRIGGDDEFISAKDTHVGLTFGGGVTGMYEDRFGIRADVRYLRDLKKLKGDSEFFSLGDANVDFWRGTVGFVVRF